MSGSASPVLPDEASPTCSFDGFVALINRGSGERVAGNFVEAQLQRLMGPSRVFSLFPVHGQPPAVVEARAFILAHRPKAIVVAGGDGTVSLALDITDELRREGLLAPLEAPVAVMPLGTGNDFSINMGHGAGYTKPMFSAKHKFEKLLRRTLMESNTVCVDRFSLRIDAVPPSTTSAASSPQGSPSTALPRDDNMMKVAAGDDAPPPPPSPSSSSSSSQGQTGSDGCAPHPRAPDTTTAATQQIQRSFMNYFSIGFDAEVAERFDEFRRERPAMCHSRRANKLWYAMMGGRALFTTRALSRRHVRIRIDGAETAMPAGTKALIVGNATTYAGGHVLWQDRKQRYSSPGMEDALVEVMGLYGLWHMVGVGAKLRAARKLGQGCAVELVVPVGFSMQYDGEPLDLSAVTGDEVEQLRISITHLTKSVVMERQRRHK